MFDVSALPSLKPAGPVLDQALSPASDALQISSFSQILSGQLEAAPTTEGSSPSSVADLATFVVVADGTGKRQAGGKILPEALPEPAEPTSEGSEVAAALQINPLKTLLANRSELKAPQVASPKAKPQTDDEGAIPSGEASDEALPEEGPAAILVQPETLAATIQPAIPATTTLAPQGPKGGSSGGLTAEPEPTKAAASETLAPAALVTISATIPSAQIPAAVAARGASAPIANLPLAAVAIPGEAAAATVVTLQPATVPQAAIGVPSATLADILLPQTTSPAILAKVVAPTPGSAAVPIELTLPTQGSSTTASLAAAMPATASTIALVAAQAQQAAIPASSRSAAQPVAADVAQTVETAAKAAPAIAASAPQVAAPVPTGLVPSTLAAATTVIVPAATAVPRAAAPLAAPDPETAETIADQPITVTRRQPARAQAGLAARQAADIAVPAQASAASTLAVPSSATESSTPVTAAPQPSLILADARQPVVSPAMASLTQATPAETPQDFAALVDRLIAARETAAPQTVQASISHADFGRVSLDFNTDGGDLTVAMKSADPGFAPAVLAAMAADKPASVGDSQPLQTQQQASLQAQAGAQAQMQNQSQPQNQQQSQQSQQPGGQSAQLHQDGSSQRQADGSGAQGRDGQDRGQRYRSNPSQAGRDSGSSQPRNGTYA